MLTLHLITGITVLAANLLAGVWGGVSWYLRRPSVGSWNAPRLALGALVVLAAPGALLTLLGREAPDGLHYVYGLLPIVVALLGEGARAVATEHELEGLDFESLPRDRQAAVAAAISRRETGIMAVSALVILGLALRAAFTSPL